MTTEVLLTWSASLPSLTRVELLGPFLVYASAWCAFFESHPKLEGFLITQSPRFDVDCVKSLVENCGDTLREVRLKEIGKMSDEFLEHIELLQELTYLDLSYPGDPEALSEPALIKLMREVGGALIHLDLSGNIQIGNGFLLNGLRQYARRLQRLIMADLVEISDAVVAEFFDTWTVPPPLPTSEGGEDKDKQTGLNTGSNINNSIPNPPLITINLSRNPDLSGLALLALLRHSGSALEELTTNGWKSTPKEALLSISKLAPKARKLDLGWCREVDDDVVMAILEGCKGLKEVGLWGCQRVGDGGAGLLRKRGVALLGAEVLAGV